MIHLDIKKVYNIIASNANIKDYYIWYINHCTSMNLPYHNLCHTMKMLQLIIELHERSQKIGNDYGFQLDNGGLYILLTSALFHDYNHSGGRYSDAINIENAINGLETCMNTYLQSDESSQAVIMQCAETIKGTEYPYKISDENLNLYQKILRECDILVVFFDDFVTHNVFGLCEEMKTTNNIGEFIKKYYEFLSDSLQKMTLKFSKDIIAENFDDWNACVTAMLKTLI